MLMLPVLLKEEEVSAIAAVSGWRNLLKACRYDGRSHWQETRATLGICGGLAACAQHHILSTLPRGPVTVLVECK